MQKHKDFSCKPWHVILNILLFTIKIDNSVDIVKLVIGSTEFEGQRRGCRAQGFFGQNRLHLSLDRKLL